MVLRVRPRVMLSFVDQVILNLLCDIADNARIPRIAGSDEKLNLHNASHGWADYGYRDLLTPTTILDRAVTQLEVLHRAIDSTLLPPTDFWPGVHDVPLEWSNAIRFSRGTRDRSAVGCKRC